ncbi:MAG: response regulator [Pseudomonadota bacterium]
MKDIVDWLTHIESMSARLYRQSADYFQDAALKEFLEHSADDEAVHYKIMVTAAETILVHPEIKSAITMDAETKRRIEAPFHANAERLKNNTLSRESLIDGLIETEFSEWNSIFLYVVNSLTRLRPEFKGSAAKIQHHLRHIEHFLGSDSYGKQKMFSLRDLQPVWNEKILVVEDDPAVLEILVTILSKEGVVDTAKNGEIGLEKIHKDYYRMIISDVGLPVMSGIEMFQAAAGEFPDLASRFLFLTGYPSRESVSFFNNNKLKYLVKPVSIYQITNTVLEMIHNIKAA